MADDKRIYELDTATDTQGKLIMVDTVSASDATFVPVPYHMVTTLPSLPISDCLYYLTETDNFAPKGVYVYNNGWICRTCLEVLTLPDTSGSIDMSLYSGASYVMDIIGDITNINITLSADGICRIILNNPTAYSVDGISVGYKTTNFGLDALGAESVRFVIQRDTINSVANNEYSAVKRIPTN